jgi:hypothetical protein
VCALGVSSHLAEPIKPQLVKNNNLINPNLDLILLGCGIPMIGASLAGLDWDPGVVYLWLVLLGINTHTFSALAE